MSSPLDHTQYVTAVCNLMHNFVFSYLSLLFGRHNGNSVAVSFT